MKIKITTILFLNLFVYLPFSFAQLTQDGYLEFPVVDGELQNYIVLDAEEAGLVLLNEQVDGPNEKYLTVRGLDTDLKEKWSKKLELTALIQIVQSTFDNNALYILVKFGNNQYNILRINTSTGDLLLFPINGYSNFNIRFFEALEGILFLGGEIDNVPLVLRFEYEKATPRILHQEAQKNTKLLDLKVNPVSNSVHVVISKSRSEKGLYILNFDIEGSRISNFYLPEEDRYVFNNCFIASQEKEHFLLIGSYGTYANGPSVGVFSIEVEGKEVLKNNFFNFGNMTNFYNHLSPNEKQRIERRRSKAEQKGKPFKTSYKLTDEQFSVVDDYFIYTANAFSQLNFGAASTAIFGFDKDGNLAWDNSFVHLQNSSSGLRLESKVLTISNEDEIVMVRKAKGNFIFKKMKANEYNPRVLEMIPDTGNPNEQSELLNERSFFEWYDQFIISSGLKSITSATDSNAKKKVFFLVKAGVSF